MTFVFTYSRQVGARIVCCACRFSRKAWKKTNLVSNFARCRFAAAETRSEKQKAKAIAVNSRSRTGRCVVLDMRFADERARNLFARLFEYSPRTGERSELGNYCTEALAWCL